MKNATNAHLTNLEGLVQCCRRRLFEVKADTPY
jgi:hypothetical protein